MIATMIAAPSPTKPPIAPLAMIPAVKVVNDFMFLIPVCLLYLNYSKGNWIGKGINVTKCYQAFQ